MRQSSGGGHRLSRAQCEHWRPTRGGSGDLRRLWMWHPATTTFSEMVAAIVEKRRLVKLPALEDWPARRPAVESPSTGFWIVLAVGLAKGQGPLSDLERSRPRGGRYAWPGSARRVGLEYCRVIGGPVTRLRKNDAGETPASQLRSEYNSHVHPHRRGFRTVLQASAGRVGPGAHPRVSGTAFQQAKTGPPTR